MGIGDVAPAHRVVRSPSFGGRLAKVVAWRLRTIGLGVEGAVRSWGALTSSECLTLTRKSCKVGSRIIYIRGASPSLIPVLLMV